MASRKRDKSVSFDDIQMLIDKSQKGKGRPLCRFLYHLSRYLKAKMCLEIGVYYGEATTYMCKSGSKVVGIDWIPTGYANPNLYFIKGDSLSQKTLNKVKKYGKFDMVFHDSSHHHIPSKLEWEMYSPLVRRGGVWVCDDIHESFHNTNPNPNGDPRYQNPAGKGMIEFFNEIPTETKKIYPDVLSPSNGTGIVLL